MSTTATLAPAALRPNAWTVVTRGAWLKLSPQLNPPWLSDTDSTDLVLEVAVTWELMTPGTLADAVHCWPAWHTVPGGVISNGEDEPDVNSGAVARRSYVPGRLMARSA